jgi:hypothetical protein
MSTDPTTVAETYFDAWEKNDFERLQSVLADDVVFDGPLGHVEGAADCRQGIERLSQIKRDLVVVKRVADGPDVFTWFELHTTVAPPTPIVNWSHVEDGKISRIRVTFDPREIIGGSS